MQPAIQPRLYCPHCHAVFRTPFSRCPLDGTELATDFKDPLINTTIDRRYDILECIGEGGMGRVYRAKHTRMSRTYAIKVLFGDHASDARMRTRFAREAEAVSRLSHPNVRSVLDFGETPEGLLYLVMDLAMGRSLSTAIKEDGPFAPSRAIAILGHLARGLSHAHDRGLVHRDFKSENVILTNAEGGEVPKIVDFGICMIVEEAPANTTLTSAGMVLGTPAVMAPEQASGDIVDHRTDLFSLGIVGYRMLTGKLPFDGTPMEMARKNLYEDMPTMASRCGREFDTALEAIIAKLAAKRPENRYQSAHEVLTALAPLAETSNESWLMRTPTPRPVPRTPDSTPPSITRQGTADTIALTKQASSDKQDEKTEALALSASRGHFRLALPGLLVVGAIATWLLWPSGSSPTKERPAARQAASTPTPDASSRVPIPSLANTIPDAGVAQAMTSMDAATAPLHTGSPVQTEPEPTPRKSPRKRAQARTKPRVKTAQKEMSISAISKLYGQVGSAITTLERKRGKAVAADLRRSYSTISLTHLIQHTEARPGASKRLLHLQRKLRTLNAQK